MSFTMCCRACPGKVFAEAGAGDRLHHVGIGVNSGEQAADGKRRDADHLVDPVDIDSREIQERLYEIVVRRIREVLPAGRFALFETTDQSVGYGFVLLDVLADGGVTVADAVSLDLLRDELAGELSDMNWRERGGVLGENKHGYAQVML